jgi:hypothetical protein
MRCYFHLVSYHDAVLDEVGIEVTDLEAAEAEALRAIKELREEEGAASDDWHDWHLRVTDRSGQVFLTIPLDPRPRHESSLRIERSIMKRTAQVHGLLIGLGSMTACLELAWPC